MSDDGRAVDGGADASVTPPPPDASTELDEDTLRVMISTDNHLGYAERDAVRGLDSFAAFEEVLSLAKRHKVRETEMVDRASPFTDMTKD